MTLRKFLIIGATLLAVFLIVALSLTIQYVAAEVYAGTAFANFQQTADRTFKTLRQSMLNGASREEIETIVRQLTGGNATNETISIYCDQRVAEHFSPLSQPPMSLTTMQAFRGGERVELRGDGFLQSSYPIIAIDACLTCHDNTRPGEVMGVIDIHRDTRAEIATFRRRMLKAAFPIALSCGVACRRPDDTITLEALISQADSRMYENKKQRKAARRKGLQE